jgi:oligopeptide/dipeptide ABC transporter ATP-binding protein
MAALLEVEELEVRLPGPSGPVTVVDRISFSVEEGEIFGVAGESGSGKTMSTLALVRLLPKGAEVRGRATFDGVDLLRLSGRALRQRRGNRLSMVFQDPMTSLHPMLSIERQMTDHVRSHLGMSRKAARGRAVELLEEVRIPDPERALASYPHQFSGGMRQRIAIAIALACHPSLLIADEPTTALDVTVQAGIIALLSRLRRDHGLAVILITHDLGVMSTIADRLTVFYAGRVVESGLTRDVIKSSRHPYTRGLLEALPHPEATDRRPLVPIVGVPATPHERPPGCAFHPRCKFAIESCQRDVPPLRTIPPRRELACSVDPFRGESSLIVGSATAEAR